jgi:hypothetical protein
VCTARPPVRSTDGAKSAGQVANEACKIHVSQAGRPSQASRRATCLCLSVGLFPLWGYERSSAHLYLYAPVLPDLYSKQRRTAGQPIFHVSLIFYIPLISMLIMVLFAAKKSARSVSLVHVRAFIISLFKRSAPI